MTSTDTARHRDEPARRTRGKRRRTMVVSLPIALLVSSAVVYEASNAAFTASTSNGTNQWSSGTVVLADDDTGSVMFSATNLGPGDTDTKCINVTYTGTLAGAVKFYLGTPTGTLGQYIDFTVEQGSGATGGNTLSCTGFVSATTLSSGGDTLDTFAAAHSSFATGVSSWSPTGAASETKSYRITYTLQNSSSVMGLSASAMFTWEAQNT